MIFEAPLMLAITEQKERMDNCLRAISALIPEDHADLEIHGIEASKVYGMIIDEIKRVYLGEQAKKN